MIDGVCVEKLKMIEDSRGKVMHMMRRDSSLFTAFGEIYFSTVKPGVVKAWKKHKKMTQLFAVPVGKIKIVIYDGRDASSTKNQLSEMEIGEENYCLLKIPPGLWYGFKGLSSAPALIANCADIPHDPLEIENRPSNDERIPYLWE